MRYTTMNMILRQFAIHSILLEHVHRGTHINVQGLDDRSIVVVHGSAVVHGHGGDGHGNGGDRVGGCGVGDSHGGGRGGVRHCSKRTRAQTAGPKPSVARVSHFVGQRQSTLPLLTRTGQRHWRPSRQRSANAALTSSCPSLPRGISCRARGAEPPQRRWKHTGDPCRRCPQHSSHAVRSTHASGRTA
jgi:hypothetical protein